MASIFYRAALASLPMTGFPIVAGFLIGLAYSFLAFANPNGPLFNISIALMVIGWVLLVRSKRDQVRTGDVMTSGISNSELRMRTLYRLSYEIMIFEWLMACFSGTIR